MSDLWLFASQALSAISHPNAGLVISGAFAFATAFSVALIAWWRSRGTTHAAQQTALNDAWRTGMEGIQSLLEETRKALEESRQDRVRLAARASEQEHKIDLLEDRLGDALRDRQVLSGEITNLKQANESRARLEAKHGTSPIPDDSALNKPTDEEDQG